MAHSGRCCSTFADLKPQVKLHCHLSTGNKAHTARHTEYVMTCLFVPNRLHRRSQRRIILKLCTEATAGRTRVQQTQAKGTNKKELHTPRSHDVAASSVARDSNRVRTTQSRPPPSHPAPSLGPTKSKLCRHHQSTTGARCDGIAPTLEEVARKQEAKIEVRGRWPNVCARSPPRN